VRSARSDQCARKHHTHRQQRDKENTTHFQANNTQHADTQQHSTQHTTTSKTPKRQQQQRLAAEFGGSPLPRATALTHLYLRSYVLVVVFIHCLELFFSFAVSMDTFFSLSAVFLTVGFVSVVFVRSIVLGLRLKE